MSDGNFNRSLLPANSYQSGVRAGQAQMRIKAINVLSELLSGHFPDLPEEKRNDLIRSFREKTG